MRLINVAIDSNNAGSSYNPQLGALGAIRNISIFDGSVLLEQLTDATLLNAFKNVQAENDYNLSVNRFLKYNDNGYTMSGVPNFVNNTELAKNSYQLATQNPVANNIGQKAWVSLRDCISFLRSSSVVPTNVFRQFRVVVEYNDAAALKYLTSVTNATVATSADALFLVDEVNDGDAKDSMMRNYEGVSYRPIEAERVVVPAVTVADDTESEQSLSFLVNGFNNKRLNRLLIVQQAGDSTTYDVGNATVGNGIVSSVPQWKTRLNLRVNGKNLLAGDGISGSSATAQNRAGSSANRRLAYLTDAWGNTNLTANMNVVAYNDEPDFVSAALRARGQDYLGLMVQSEIQELQVQYQRTAIGAASGDAGSNAAQRQQLLLNLFGEVERAVVMGAGGSYNVIYVV
tara:strand:+ start:2201 stop:3403 length:1203 start_codon:yes stop_codon:yes gene_type:complete